MRAGRKSTPSREGWRLAAPNPKNSRPNEPQIEEARQLLHQERLNSNASELN
jgi:hypothetical protein